MKKAAARVLCVDDNPHVLQVLQTALMKSSYAVETASSGWQAFQRLRSGRNAFRVVVTDIRMPGLSGLRMIQQARAIGFRGPFVVCAAGVSDADRAALIELGVQQIVEKTAGVPALIDAVEQAASTYIPVEANPLATPAINPGENEDGFDAVHSSDDDALDEEAGQRYHPRYDHSGQRDGRERHLQTSVIAMTKGAPLP